MTAFHICGFDSVNEPVDFCVTIDDQDITVIKKRDSDPVTDDNGFLSCMLSDSHWKLGETHSWTDQESVGLGHAIIQYILRTYFGYELWFNYVSIVRVQ